MAWPGIWTGDIGARGFGSVWLAREIEAVARAAGEASAAILSVGVDRADAGVVVSEKVPDDVSDHPSAAEAIAARAQFFDGNRCGFGPDLV